MSAVLGSFELEISQAMDQFDVGEVIDCKAAHHGIENANYFIKTRDKERERNFVLTFVQQPSNAGHLYAPMMQALYDQGLPVAPPLKRSIDIAHPILLQQRLPGSHVVNPTHRQIQALGRFTARMHLTMAQTSISLPVFPRTPIWLLRTVEPWLSHVAYTDRVLLADSIDRVSALLQRQDVAALPRGMIHGDLFRDNVLFNERGITGVLDFHHAAAGFWLFDLAVIANDWCTDAQGQLDPDRAQALLKSYHKIRQLQDQELWFFSNFTLYAALCFWVSRLVVDLAAQKQPGIRSKNPKEFQRIVQQHTRHPFYLDPRQLDI